MTGIKFRAAKGEGEILIYGDIGWDITAKTFADEMKQLGPLTKLDVRINSYGGDVFDGVAIYSRLMDMGAQITVHIDGIAASAASVIAMAGSRIRIAKPALVMIHDAWASGSGNAADFRRKADQLEAVSAQMAGIYERRTGNDLAQIRAWMAEEREWYGDDAVAAGLADETFDLAADEKMAAKFDPARHHFRRTPTPALPKNRAEAQRVVAAMRMRAAAR